mgnify:CR=1 FL=1
MPCSRSTSVAPPVEDWQIPGSHRECVLQHRSIGTASLTASFRAVSSTAQTFGEFLDPIAHVHFNVEGTIEFTSMLFIPGMAPFEQQNWAAKSRSIKLYVRRVFISDEFDEDLMPR